MAIQNLDFGTAADGDGEYPYTAWPKVQANFQDLDGRVTAHAVAADPHPQYHNNARGDARYAGVGHGHDNATGGAHGFMSSSDKAKLDAIEAGAKADHGALTGLSDDDHPQYHNNTRGDARYLVHALTMQPKLSLIQASPIRDIWWGGMDTTASTPRTYTISSVAGANVTLTADMVPGILHTSLHDVVLIRVWNTSKTPAQAAWVKYQVSVNTFTVSNAAHISGWLTGETLRLGDPNPTGSNVLSMIAIDISPYMQAHLGAVFPQKGLKVAIAPQGVGGRAQIDISGNGALGSEFGPYSSPDGSPQQAMFDVFTDQLSPVSNSNLFFFRETLISGTALSYSRLVRLAGIYV